MKYYQSIIFLLFLWIAAAAGAFAAESSTQEATALEKATFAGGCFWCMEAAFDKIDGVVSTTSGYTGGQKDSPTYQEVSSGETGHSEAVEVAYNPQKVSYEQLLAVFWRNIDPTVKDRQFCDVGNQYRTAIYYHSDEQKRLAERSKQDIEKRLGSVQTEIVPVSAFYTAEEYHQDFYKKNPERYQAYREGCGQDERLKEVWNSDK
ncbi:peptide methionine sulfoxide reductase msrA 1 [Candidatus Moduliflexus flocculans]|uniref:Peptide methionine sulfoxide reductase MsrA n=1 Tax=Candidatus Moduliflexus flocculans TaxID=1499966 RepID=A0A081BMG8_9BACT|nr:peptide methionine sulfoxide reductase msrA 1 [Candidatus Moduliflexus flocculans]